MGEGSGFPWTRITGSCELAKVRHWELNLDPLKEKYMLLISSHLPRPCYKTSVCHQKTDIEGTFFQWPVCQPSLRDVFYTYFTLCGTVLHSHYLNDTNDIILLWYKYYLHPSNKYSSATFFRFGGELKHAHTERIFIFPWIGFYRCNKDTDFMNIQWSSLSSLDKISHCAFVAWSFHYWCAFFIMA